MVTHLVVFLMASAGGVPRFATAEALVLKGSLPLSFASVLYPTVLTSFLSSTGHPEALSLTTSSNSLCSANNSPNPPANRYRLRPTGIDGGRHGQFCCCRRQSAWTLRTYLVDKAHDDFARLGVHHALCCNLQPAFRNHDAQVNHECGSQILFQYLARQNLGFLHE